MELVIRLDAGCEITMDGGRITLYQSDSAGELRNFQSITPEKYAGSRVARLDFLRKVLQISTEGTSNPNFSRLHGMVLSLAGLQQAQVKINRA